MALIFSQSRRTWSRLVPGELCPDPRGTKRLFVAWSQNLRVNDKAQSNEGLTSPPPCLFQKS